MSRTERQRAERCFALARSTKFGGERENAIRKGTEIAERAGIDLDEFDIPGRSPTKRFRPTSDRLFEGNGIFGAAYVYGSVNADDLIRDIDAMMRSAAMQNSKVYAEQARRQRAAIRLELAIKFLRSRGCVVKDCGDGTFTVDNTHSPYAKVGPDLVILAAQSRGWRG